MLLDLLKPTDLDVTVNSPSRQEFSRCVFGDRDKEIVIDVHDSIGFDSLGVPNGLVLFDCLNHLGVIGRRGEFLEDNSDESVALK